MFKYQTVWQREGIILTNRFAVYLSKDARPFQVDKNYIKKLEIGMIGSLIAVTAVFLIWKRVEVSASLQNSTIESITVEDIPKTEQSQRAPAPSRPTVPIPSEDESLPEYETIDFTDLDLQADPPKPPPPPTDEDMETMFVAFDEPPMPVGGFNAVKRNVRYPDVAQRAGLEGTVVLNLRILANGSIGEIRIIQSVMSAMDKAAEDAVRSVQWTPAKQRDEPVAVWYVVPIEFKLRTKSP